MVIGIQRLRKLQDEVCDLEGAVDGATEQVNRVATRLKQLNPQPSL